VSLPYHLDAGSGTRASLSPLLHRPSSEYAICYLAYIKRFSLTCLIEYGYEETMKEGTLMKAPFILSLCLLTQGLEDPPEVIVGMRWAKLEIDLNLLMWAQNQPEDFNDLVCQLLAAERLRRE
jgi:hypothetical protein